MTDSTAGDVLAIPNGARFFRCALQVNPNDYASYRGQSPDPDAAAYAQRLIDEAVKNGIKVLAITHHNNCDFVEVIRPLAQQAEVVIFPGFELKSHEGVQRLGVVRQSQPLAGIEKNTCLGRLNPETESVFSEQAHALRRILGQDADRDPRVLHGVFS